MKDDKCREAWGLVYKKPVTKEAQDFTESLGIESFADKVNAGFFHAGYHARKVPTVEEMIEVAQATNGYSGPLTTEMVCKAIHRLLVGEEGE